MILARTSGLGRQSRKPMAMSGHRFATLFRARLCLAVRPLQLSYRKAFAPSVVISPLNQAFYSILRPSFSVALAYTMSTIATRIANRFVTTLHRIRQSFSGSSTKQHFTATRTHRLARQRVSAQATEFSRIRPHTGSSLQKSRLTLFPQKGYRIASTAAPVTSGLPLTQGASRLPPSTVGPRERLPATIQSFTQPLMVQRMFRALVRHRINFIRERNTTRLAASATEHARAAGTLFMQRSRTSTRSSRRGTPVRGKRIVDHAEHRRTTSTHLRHTDTHLLKPQVVVEKRIQPVEFVYQQRQEMMAPATVVTQSPAPASPPRLDVRQLSEDVMRRIQKQVFIERERRGLL